nr:hypothetical protein [Bacilli bacterium]
YEREEDVPALGHHFTEWQEDIAATCTAKGREKRVCEHCGLVEYNDIPMLSHSPVPYDDVAADCTHDGHIGGSYCEHCHEEIEPYTVVDKTSHTFGPWETVVEATCTSKGQEKRVCSVCGYTEYQVIEMKEHHYVQGEIEESTCTTHGHTADVHCSECGLVKTESEILPLGEHTFGPWETVVEATCTSKGQEKRVCSVCGYTEYQVIEMKEHNYVQGDAVASTCTTHGHTADVHCSECGHVKEASVELPLKEHNYVYNRTISSPTFTSKGVAEYICKDCSTKINVAIDRLEFKRDDWKNAIADFTNMEATFRIADENINLDVNVDMINKDNICYIRVTDNVNKLTKDYYKLSDGTVIESTPFGYKHALYDEEKDLYNKYYTYLYNAFYNSPGESEFVYEESSGAYRVTGTLKDYLSRDSVNSIASLAISSDGKPLYLVFQSDSVIVNCSLNYSPSVLNAPTAHYHQFDGTSRCKVCGETCKSYTFVKDNIILNYYDLDSDIQFEFKMTDDKEVVPEFEKPIMYRSSSMDLVRFTQTWTRNGSTETIYLYYINNCGMVDYVSDDLEKQFGKTRVGYTDAAIMPDGSKAHLMYSMDTNSYVKVYKDGLSDNMIVFQGKALNISGSANDLYIYIKSSTENIVYELHYDGNIEIKEWWKA